MIQYKKIELYTSRLLIFTFCIFLIKLCFFASLCDAYKGSITNVTIFTHTCYICNNMSHIFKKELLIYNVYLILHITEFI